MTRPVNRERSRTAKSSANARFVALVERANRAGTALVVAAWCCRGRLA